jgi:diacylglycerol diphosphate phosphatase/phosphatidate phosphatase
MHNWGRERWAVVQKSDWFHKSYLMDWVACALTCIVAGVVALTVSPYCRYTPDSDSMTNYPNNADIIPSWTLLLMVFVGPGLVWACSQWINSFSSHDTHSFALALVEGISICLLITQLGKVYAGRPRPDWLAKVVESGANPADMAMLCADRSLFDARSSFPSGHSSMSVVGMTVVALYLAGKMRMFLMGRGHMHYVALFVMPFLLAGIVAVSRTKDYHHNYSDVIAGSIIGLLCGFLAYFLHYPSLSARDCHLPFNRKHHILYQDGSPDNVWEDEGFAMEGGIAFDNGPA